MGIIKDASICKKCGAETTLSYGVASYAIQDGDWSDHYQVVCLECHHRWKAAKNALDALQNVRNDISEEPLTSRE